ncbi:MAG: hypothetical protein K5662_05260 [Lachnospiraceae bacterium]|nr:hypothetical protein [Lachnospiraceae bacterium]
MGKDEKIFSQMVEANRVRNAEKEKLAVTTIKKMVTENTEVTIAGLIKQTGLSRSFFYNNETVHEELMRAKKLQRGKDFNSPKRRVMDKAMTGRLRILEEQLAKRNDECARLREENAKMKDIISASNFQAYQNL